ncbi:MAG: hypothetical protein ACLUZ4_05020 [Christensenellaceae bacterium]
MKQITEKRIKSPMPAYTAAACIIVFGLIFPLYRVYGIVITAVIAAAAYFFSKKCFFKDKIIQEERTCLPHGYRELDESLNRRMCLSSSCAGQISASKTPPSVRISTE